MLSSSRHSLFSDPNNTQSASTSPLLKSHFPRDRSELIHALGKILQPLGVEPEHDAHLQHVRDTIDFGKHATLMDISPTENGARLCVSIEVNALAEAFRKQNELNEILGSPSVGNKIYTGRTDNTSRVDLLYHQSAIPHFIKWCQDSVKALDEERLQSLRNFSESDQSLAAPKQTFAEHINQQLISLERELIVEHHKDILIGELLTARRALIPQLARLDRINELNLTEEQKDQLPLVLEAFKLIAGTINNEADLRDRPSAKQILNEIDDYCTEHFAPGPEAGNIQSGPPSMQY